MTQVLKPRQLYNLLTKAIPAREPVLVTGAPGIGKTDIVTQAAVDAGARLIVSHPAVMEPTDFTGIPWPRAAENGAPARAEFLPIGDFAAALAAEELTVWAFDDLGQALPATQNACMQLFLARRINSHILPPSITFAACTNRRTDRANVAGLSEPVKSRFATIVELEPDVNDWTQWALGNNIPPLLIAFMRFKPALLSAFEPTLDLVNSPSPRTWSNAARIEKLGLAAEVEAVALAGAVGAGAATEYLAYKAMVAERPSVAAILADPASVPLIPHEKTGIAYAVSVSLAHAATPSNFQAIATYCQRLVDNTRGEYASLIVSDAERLHKEKITHAPGYIELMSGPVGQLIAGQRN